MNRPSQQRSRATPVALYLFLAAAVLMLAACQTVGSKKGFAACKTADVASTVAAIEVTGAKEANPIIAAVMKKAGYFGLIGIAAMVVWLVYENDAHDETTQGVVNVATCGVAVHNLMLLK